MIDEKEFSTSPEELLKITAMRKSLSLFVTTWMMCHLHKYGEITMNHSRVKEGHLQLQRIIRKKEIDWSLLIEELAVSKEKPFSLWTNHGPVHAAWRKKQIMI